MNHGKGKPTQQGREEVEEALMAMEPMSEPQLSGVRRCTPHTNIPLTARKLIKK